MHITNHCFSSTVVDSWRSCLDMTKEVLRPFEKMVELVFHRVMSTLRLCIQKIFASRSEEELRCIRDHVRLYQRRGGLVNPGRLCFQSALLQAYFSLSHCSFAENDDLGKKLNGVYRTVMQGKTGSAGISSEIWEKLQKRGCQGSALRGGDPLHVHAIIRALLRPRARWYWKTREDYADCCVSLRTLRSESIQELLNRKVRKDKKVPEFFEVTVDGRQGKERYETNVHIPLYISLFSDREKYQLRSVVEFLPHFGHYVCLEPKYDGNGNVCEWIAYNDALVMRIDSSLFFDIQSQGYMFFYENISHAKS